MGKLLEALASAVNGPRHAPRGFGIVALDPLANTLKVIRLPVRTNEFASRLQEALQALADLLMRQVFAPLQCVLSALHGLNEVGFFLEIPGNDFLRELVRAPALLRCRVG